MTHVPDLMHRKRKGETRELESEPETEISWWASRAKWDSLTQPWRFQTLHNVHSQLDLSFEVCKKISLESVVDQWNLYFSLIEIILRNWDNFGVTRHGHVTPEDGYILRKIPGPYQAKDSFFVCEHPTKETLSFALREAPRAPGGWYFQGFVHGPAFYYSGSPGPIRGCAKGFDIPSVSPKLMNTKSQSTANYQVHYLHDPFCFIDGIRKSLAVVIAQRELRVICMQSLFFGSEQDV